MDDKVLKLYFKAESIFELVDGAFEAPDDEQINHCVRGDLYFSQYHGESDEEEKEKVGSISGYLIRSEEYDSDIMDSHSADTESLISAIDQLTEEEDYLGQIIIVDRIEIEEKYKRKGYGAILLKKFVKNYAFPSCSYTFLIASPYKIKRDDPTYKQEQENLFNFYEKLDFTKMDLGSDSSQKNIFYRDNNYLFPGEAR